MESLGRCRITYRTQGMILCARVELVRRISIKSLMFPNIGRTWTSFRDNDKSMLRVLVLPNADFRRCSCRPIYWTPEDYHPFGDNLRMWTIVSLPFLDIADLRQQHVATSTDFGFILDRHWHWRHQNECELIGRRAIHWPQRSYSGN